LFGPEAEMAKSALGISAFLVLSVVLLALAGAAPRYLTATEAVAAIDLPTAVIATVFILVGVLAKIVYDAISDDNSQRRSTRNLLQDGLSIRNLIRSLIISPVVLSLIYNDLKDLPDFVLMMISFQNGFFFQTVTQRS
jgi:hypothetical protein